MTDPAEQDTPAASERFAYLPSDRQRAAQHMDRVDFLNQLRLAREAERSESDGGGDMALPATTAAGRAGGKRAAAWRATVDLG